MPTTDERLSYGFSTTFLNKNKSIKSLVDKAIKNSWTSQRFLDELRQTSWWKSRSDAQKRYDVMRVENPGEFDRQLSQSKLAVKNLSIRLGVNLSASQINSIATSWMKNGLEEDEVRDMIGKRYSGSPDKYYSRENLGVAGAARVQFIEMAREYGFKLGHYRANQFARAVARGVRTVEDYQAYFRGRAESLFPAIRNDLREGRTVREIIEPYMAIAAEELGIPVSIMDTTNSKWLAPISGEHQFTTDTWVKTLRSDKKYGYDQTQNAQRQASMFATQLMSRMGAM